jgi:hypothetical protein
MDHLSIVLTNQDGVDIFKGPLKNMSDIEPFLRRYDTVEPLNAKIATSIVLNYTVSNIKDLPQEERDVLKATDEMIAEKYLYDGWGKKHDKSAIYYTMKCF